MYLSKLLMSGVLSSIKSEILFELGLKNSSLSEKFIFKFCSFFLCLHTVEGWKNLPPVAEDSFLQAEQLQSTLDIKKKSRKEVADVRIKNPWFFDHIKNDDHLQIV